MIYKGHYSDSHTWTVRISGAPPPPTPPAIPKELIYAIVGIAAVGVISILLVRKR